MASAFLTALKAEIAKPAYGKKSDEEIAAMLGGPSSDAVIDRDRFESGEIAASVTKADFANLQANERLYLQFVANAGPIPVTATLKTELAGLFAQGTATRANLVALMKRSGTKAEEAGLSRVPSPSDVADARRL